MASKRSIILLWLLIPFLEACSERSERKSIHEYTPTPPLIITSTKASTNPITPENELFDLNDPRLITLEEQGFFPKELVKFEVDAVTESMQFGGPSDKSSGTVLTTQLEDGSAYLYMQYQSNNSLNCYLVFALRNETKTEVISIIAATSINEQLEYIFGETSDFEPPVFCNSYGWHDINQNGRPDMTISFLWASRLAGSESHIFEITEENSVIDLTQDLPRIVSPWDYDPNQREQIVWDFSWTTHDCFYPPLYLFWIYAWQEDQYVDVTQESNYTSNYLNAQIEDISSDYGKPLYAYGTMNRIAQVLLVYDRNGQREQGWQQFLEMTDLTNWPNSSDADLEWLEADVVHFTAQYEAEIPFSPNDYCPEW